MPLLPLCLHRHCACCSGLPIPRASPVLSCRDSLPLPAALARPLPAVPPSHLHAVIQRDFYPSACTAPPPRTRHPDKNKAPAAAGTVPARSAGRSFSKFFYFFYFFMQICGAAPDSLHFFSLPFPAPCRGFPGRCLAISRNSREILHDCTSSRKFTSTGVHLKPVVHFKPAGCSPQTGCSSETRSSRQS